MPAARHGRGRGRGKEELSFVPSAVSSSHRLDGVNPSSCATGSRGCTEAGQRVARRVAAHGRVGCAASEQGYAIARHDGAEERSRRRWRATGRSRGGIEELNPWMMKKLREPPSLASREDDQGTCVVQKGQKSMDYLRQTLVLVGGQGGVTLSCVCPYCHRYPLEDYIWWVSRRHGDSSKRRQKQCNWWCGACGGHFNWRDPNGALVIQDGEWREWYAPSSTPQCGNQPMDEASHAVCEATTGVEGAEWEILCDKFAEMNKEVDVRTHNASAI